MNPYLILGAVFAVLGAYGVGHHYGWSDRDQEMQVEIARKNDESREREHKLTEQINEQSSKLQEAHNAIDKKQSDLDRAIRAGRVRLPASSCVQASSGSATATGGGNQTGGQSNGQADGNSDADQATLAAIAAIVAQGDRNTEQLNACIAAYNAVREQVNAQR